MDTKGERREAKKEKKKRAMKKSGKTFGPAVRDAQIKRNRKEKYQDGDF